MGKSPFDPIMILIPYFIMQNPAIVKEFCTLSGEISVLHNPGGPRSRFCGLTISILVFGPAVNETDY